MTFKSHEKLDTYSETKAITLKSPTVQCTEEVGTTQK